jgi:hypothetical protein
VTNTSKEKMSFRAHYSNNLVMWDGQQRRISVHHDLQGFILACIDALGAAPQTALRGLASQTAKRRNHAEFF